MGKLIQPNRWDARGESLWSIVSKLVLCNHLNGNEIKQTLYSPPIPQGFGRHSVRSCLSLDGFNTNILLENTNLTNKTLEWSVPEPFAYGRGELSQVLRFCSDCLDRGFHSAMFQIESYTQCPWHRIPLEDRCPECRRDIEYEVGPDMRRVPYGCCCGRFPEYVFHQRPVPTKLRQRIISTSSRLAKHVQSVGLALNADCDPKIFVATSEPVRHDQALRLIPRITSGSLGPDIQLIDKSAEPLREKKTLSVSLRSRNPKAAVRILKNIRMEWSKAEPNDRTQFFNRVLWRPFAGAVNDAVVKIGQDFLKHHSTCWCLAQGGDSEPFTLGLSCPWRSAYELWRTKNRVLLNRGIDPQSVLTNPYMRDWVWAVEHLLVDTPSKSQPLTDPSVVFAICRRVTVDRLLRDYSLLAKRLIEMSDRSLSDPPMRISSTSGLLDVDTPSPLYLVELSRDRSTLFIDDSEVNLAFMRCLSTQGEEGQPNLNTWLRNPDLLRTGR